MPRRATPLTAAKVLKAKSRRHADGDGLHLLVRDNGTAFWIFRYVVPGIELDGGPAKPRMREMGLGRARGPNAVSLADARIAAAPLHRLVRGGIDPLEQREVEAEAARAAAPVEKAWSITFRSAARQFIDAHEAAWRNTKHAGQWRATLETYVFPHFGDLPTARIGTAEILTALQPIWTKSPRQRAECAVVLRLSWITPRRASGDRARAQPDGAGISMICCRLGPRFAKSSITPRCRGSRSARS